MPAFGWLTLAALTVLGVVAAVAVVSETRQRFDALLEHVDDRLFDFSTED